MKDKKKLTITLVLTLVLVITIVGISYAAFIYTGTGKTLNTITTGAISMSYEESSNVISMDKALPTTDATGKKQLKAGEYFDFTVAGNIVGGESINWEIAAEDVTSSTKKIDGSHIKLYLTTVNSSGVETEVMAPTTYKSLTKANNDTGRPANQMSLATGTTDTSFSTKYRLRMYVDESYNPQGDGGSLSFTVKVNVYGKTGIKSTGGDTTSTGATTLIAKANPEDLDYASSSNGLASHFYKNERGITVYSRRSTNWTGKVGLMYPSDFGYATSGGNRENKASCMEKELFHWYENNYTDCSNNH